MSKLNRLGVRTTFETGSGTAYLYSLKKLEEIPWDTPKFKQKRFQPTACFSKEEKAQLVSLLAKLNAHLNEIK